MDRIPYAEARFYHGKLIQRQSHHGGSYVGVAMSGGNETDFSTQVPTVRCEWVPVALSCCVGH
jgi:hypothetical protein